MNKKNFCTRICCICKTKNHRSVYFRFCIIDNELVYDKDCLLKKARGYYVCNNPIHLKAFFNKMQSSKKSVGLNVQNVRNLFIDK